MERAEFKPCPYWRKHIQYGDYILAMCAVESENNPPYRSSEDMPPFRRECPLYGSQAVNIAFKMPLISEFNISGDSFTEADYAVGSDFTGLGGVFQLEDIWDQEVEKFIERHSQPQ